MNPLIHVPRALRLPDFPGLMFGPWAQARKRGASNHPPTIAAVRHRNIGSLHSFGFEPRHACDQASRGILKMVMMLNNLIPLVAPVEPQFD